MPIDEIVLVATIASFIALSYQGRSYSRELEYGASAILKQRINVRTGWSSALLIIPAVRERTFREIIYNIVDSPMMDVTHGQEAQLLRLIDRIVGRTD